MTVRQRQISTACRAATIVGPVLVLVALLFSGLTPSVALAQSARSTSPWLGWHGPYADGIVDLRFGMDRFTVGEILREQGFQGRPSREATLRYAGELMGEPVEVVLDFLDASSNGSAGRLFSVQLHWSLRGVARGPLRMYEKLDGLLTSRYEVPISVEEAEFNGMETGDGVMRKLYEGREALALLQLVTTRPERFELVFRLDSPQLRPEPTP